MYHARARFRAGIVGPVLACTFALAAAFLAARPAVPARQETPAPPDRLLLTRGLEALPIHDPLEVVRERLRKFGDVPREAERPLPALAGATPPGGHGGQLGLTVARAVADAHASIGIALDFQDETGLLRLYAFDAKRGVDAQAGLKLENDRKRKDDNEKDGERDSEGEENEERVGGAVDSLLADLRREQQAADASEAAPLDATVRWLGLEDPIDLGFRWEYAGSGGAARVTLVLDTSPLGQAGLARGDSILAMDGRPVTSPPLFGRAMHGLKAGAPLTLSVRRDAATVELAGKVGRASELVPPYEQRLIGAKLPAFTATMFSAPVEPGAGGAPVEPGAGGAPVAVGVGGDKGPALTLVLLFDPRRPDSLRDAAVLEWIRARHPQEQVAIAAIGAHASEAQVKEALRGLACSWPAAADPDGRLAEATRTLDLPDLLVADRDGVARLRQARGGELERAVRKLLAEKR